MYSSNFCCLTYIQDSQETGKAMLYSLFFRKSLCIHPVKTLYSQWSRSRCFSGSPMLVPWSNDFWSLASSKSRLYIWKFLIHVQDFEHCLASMWNEHNCVVVWTFFGTALLWDWMKTDLFQSYGHCWVFQICWHLECSTFIASSFRIWNSSTGFHHLH